MPDVSISDAEWQVMHIVWSGQPLTAQEIIGQLESQATWAPATIKTMLHRLVKKGVLAYERQGNRYVYRARARRMDCVRQASRSFLERVFGGEPAPLLAHFLRSATLTPDEVAQLRKILKEQEGQP
jgi:BlaI family penicillinase repressor